MENVSNKELRLKSKHKNAASFMQDLVNRLKALRDDVNVVADAEVDVFDDIGVGDLFFIFELQQTLNDFVAKNSG